MLEDAVDYLTSCQGFLTSCRLVLICFLIRLRFVNKLGHYLSKSIHDADRARCELAEIESRKFLLVFKQAIACKLVIQNTHGCNQNIYFDQLCLTI